MNMQEDVVAELRAAYEAGYMHGALGGRPITIPVRFDQYPATSNEWMRGFADGEAAYEKTKKEAQ